MAVEQELRKTLADAKKALGKDEKHAELVDQITAVLKALKTAGQRAADPVIREAPVPSGQIPPTKAEKLAE